MIAKPLTPCVPTRFYGWCPDGRYSLSASLQNLHDCGFTAADVSLENISLLDDAWQSVLYAAASRAKALGIALPVCHLPFYMPSPDDKVAYVLAAEWMQPIGCEKYGSNNRIWLATLS